ncbi:hypothetical protein O0I10_009556 [Lichtheimia ornata]|uniref:Uncharacterized protein n=1 Tax=Lichtheimia ornata TaxID=688661 RepID=A0AAD7XYM9_9FUNG|nr:uncharacterized protein O0I10_009556 [Lichtheimia ornata]KAJ8654832.1 hypothetical protein O0I10_009556 [Lichtheimia ornata]
MFTTIVLTTLILDLARWLVTYLLYVVVLSTTLHGDLNWLVTTSKTMLQCISEYNNSWISIRGAMLILYLFLCLVIGYMPTIGLSLLHPITHESIYDRSYDVDISCLVKEIPTPLYTNVMSSLSGYFDERCDLHDFLPDPLPKQSVSPSIVQIDNDPALSLTYHSGSKYIFNTTTFTPDSLGVTLQAFIDADIAIDYFLSLRNYPLFNMDPLLPYHEHWLRVISPTV